MASINFINERKTLDALPGTNLQELALQSGIPLYRTFQRVFHFNLKLGPMRFFSSSDIVEIEGKGGGVRSEEETKALEGRFLAKYKVTPNLRIASQVSITGDCSVKTLGVRELDRKLTKERLAYLVLVTSFAILMLFMFALVGLDLVKKM
jgi:hypothetical protein